MLPATSSTWAEMKSGSWRLTVSSASDLILFSRRSSSSWTSSWLAWALIIGEPVLTGFQAVLERSPDLLRVRRLVLRRQLREPLLRDFDLRLDPLRAAALEELRQRMLREEEPQKRSTAACRSWPVASSRTANPDRPPASGPARPQFAAAPDIGSATSQNRVSAGPGSDRRIWSRTAAMFGALPLRSMAAAWASTHA
jgi:hypothetical protein